ncbi:MAG: ecotin family protein [Phycisphaeraceae bacterium]|nr:ecotin family protein [Phycisphaeraceae bacterium]
MRYGVLGCLLLGLLAVRLALSHAAVPEPNGEDEPEWKAKARKQLKAYPKADEGMVRYVLYLEPKADESLCQVELIVGKGIGSVRRGFVLQISGFKVPKA